MPNSAGTRTDLAYVLESTQGVVPSTPSMKELRAVARNINPQKTTLESEEVKDHRQVQEQRHGFNSIDGNIDFELAYADYNDMLEAALGGTWESNVAGTPNDLLVGNTLRTFTFERRFNDINQFQVMRGVAINEMAVNIQPDSLVSVSLSVVGMGWDPMAGAELGTPAASAGNSPFNSFEGVIQEGGATIAYLTGLDFTLTNNRAVNPVIGAKEANQVDEGQVEITGTVTAQFPDAVLLEKFLNETESSISVQLDTQDASDSLTFLFPRVKYNGGNIDPPQTGPNILTLPFVALYDGVTENTALKITESNS